MALLVVLVVLEEAARFVTVWLGFEMSIELVLIKMVGAPKAPVAEKEMKQRPLVYAGCVRNHACSKAHCIKCSLTAVVAAARNGKGGVRGFCIPGNCGINCGIK